MKVYLVVWNFYGYKYEGQHDVDSIFKSKEKAESRARELELDPEVRAWLVEHIVEDAV